MLPNSQSFLNTFPPPPGASSPIQTSQDTDRSLSASQFEALQGIGQDENSIQQPQLSYPLSVSFSGQESNTQPATPLHPPTGEAQPLYGQGQNLVVSPDFSPWHNGTNISPISVPENRPWNYFSRQHNPHGSYVTHADIVQQSHTNGLQYQHPPPLTATPCPAGPTGGTELRARSLSDSGYMSRFSFGTPGNISFQGIIPNIPQSPQTVSFNGLAHPGYSPSAQYSPEASPLPGEQTPQPRTRRKRKERKVSCTHCTWEGRCASELKKHIQQKHTKPYVCNVNGCTTNFGSSSDLRRHQLSRHPSDRTPSYKCFATKKKSCLESSHIFNRRDNFKTHLEKTHGLTEKEIEEHFMLSNKWLFGLRGGSMAQNEVSLQPSVQVDIPADYNPTEEAMALEESLDMARGIKNDMDGFIDDFFKQSGGLNPPGITGSMSYPGPNITPGDLSITLAGENFPGNSNQQPQYFPRCENSDEREQSLRAVELTFPQPATTNPESNKYTCLNPGCNASFPRPSLLRKHMKRHCKPYGCTFKDCYKFFGSKADWKRHESSRHTHLERWRCDDPDITDPSRDCARMFERRVLYESHLKSHGIDDQAEIQRRLNTNRIGGDCQFRFWCGFCKVLVPVIVEGFGASMERFDHIYKHFEAGQHISSWVLPDSHLTKGEAKMQFFGRVLQHASSMTETTKSESVDSKSHFEEMMETEENGAASSLRGHRQIRTFRASSRGRRSRASMSPRGVKRQRENSQPTPDIPSMPTPEEAPDLHQTVDQFSIELANMEEVGNCPDDGLLEDFTLSNWIVTSPTEPS